VLPEETPVAQHLKLLANLVANMPVVGMQLLEVPDVLVHVGSLELLLAERLHDPQHVQLRSLTLSSFSRRNRANCCRTLAGVTAAPSITTPIFASFGMFRSTMLQPTQPARRAVAASGFRFSTADAVNTKPSRRERRDAAPKATRRASRAGASECNAVELCRDNNIVASRRTRLPFELERLVAARTPVINRLRVPRRRRKFRCRTIRTE
jgi:hypothetical protein